MRSIRKLPASLIVLLLLVPTGGQAASPRRSSDVSERALRTMQLLEGISKPDARFRSDRGRTQPGAERLQAIIARHMTSKAAALSPRNYARVVQDALEAAGLDVVGTAGHMEGPSTADVRFALGAGDLNGDRADDVVELRTRYDIETGEAIESTLLARRGQDARRMWSRSLTAYDTIVIAPGDLTGDRRADLLTLELFIEEGSFDGTCVELVCLSAGAGRFRWLLELRSGMTGRPVWSRGYDSTVVQGIADAFVPTEQLFAFGVAGVVTATNAFVIPAIGGDHDGDGTPDVVMNAIDFGEAFGFGDAYNETALVFGLADVIVTGTTAEIVRGRNGRVIYERVMPVHPGVAFLWPLGDAVGDATTDLVLEEVVIAGPIGGCVFAGGIEECPFANSVTVNAELLDGETFETAWTQSHGGPGGYGFYLSVGGDADGDGKVDLIFLSFGNDGDTSIMVSGASGEELWRRSGYVLGALGVDPSGTPLMLAVEETFDFSAWVFDLVRLDGRTGEEVSRTSHRFEISGDWWEIFILGELWLLPDADHDGVTDAFVQVTVYAGPSVTVDSVVESGASGAELFTRHADRELFGIPLGDLDGSGSTDLLDVDVVYHRNSLDLGLGGTSLPDGAGMWNSLLRLYPSFGFLDAGGDLDRDGGEDILISIFQETPSRFESAIRAISGDDGDTVWQLGSLSVPPLPGTASISGTITGEGNPFFAACVFVNDVDGNWIGTEIASTSTGAYVIPELDPGSYKLEFASCGFDPFTAEWWDDKPDFDSADVITLADGEAVTGIDADLVLGTWEE